MTNKPRQLWFLAGVLCVWTAMGAGSTTQGADWPQWMGPNRDGQWDEAGVVDAIPEGGLPVKWRVPVAGGYSGPAVVQGRVYLTDYEKSTGEVSNNPGSRNRLTGKERVHCIDAATGKTLWTYAYDCPYGISYACGPRCTPTVHDGMVYVLGAEGHLSCLNAEDGRVVWTRHLPKEYKAETPIWGYSGHPLVRGDLLFTLAGGEGSIAVALDRKTGREVWRSGTATEIGYCPPTLIRAAGKDQLLIWDPENLNSLDPETGKPYWSRPLAPSYKMSIIAPRQAGDVLFASGIGYVGSAFKLGDKTPSAEPLWKVTRTNSLCGANSTPLIVDGTLYGNCCEKGDLRALDLNTGEKLWETFDATTGSRRAMHATVYLVRNGERWFLFNDSGDLIVAKLSRKGYEERGRMRVLEATGEAFGRSVVWSHPAFAGKHMFARNDKELVCVDLSAK